jgi:hypothetical protein
VRNWDAIKRDESQSIFGDLPENLPALLFARKVIRRAANAGLRTPSPPATNAAGREAPGLAASETGDEGGTLLGETGSAPVAGGTPHGDDPFANIGQRLFELVAEARELDVDPELALRTYARRFMEGATEE